MSVEPETVRIPVVRAPEPRLHPVRRFGRWIATLALVAVVAAALAVAVVPAIAGATPLTVLSGSMEPALPVGSTVVVRPRPADQIAVGDVITFIDRDETTGDTRVVTHRVIGVEPGPAFRTMGDANNAPDPGVVETADVRGVQWYVVPWVGSIKDRMISITGLFFAIGLGLLVLAAHLLLPRSPEPDKQQDETRTRHSDGRRTA
ncbi:signal peptidase I [Pseudonocardia bannensis]|uniref:Signal peptidase I n=1 Tax=Pseudonocardia bannensis TaxID=630973 RepID=A0A848DKA0_9PSEU|nr:signal peptidase I [Pseudonocardia bannensis]NMH92979.1 signal peptidase I [Pseudonocardia bannensis]